MAARKVTFSHMPLDCFTESLAQRARQSRLCIGGDGLGEDGNHSQGLQEVIIPYRGEMFSGGDRNLGAKRA